MKKNKIYFLIGIGGIGMSSIAQYLIHQGHKVYGYDRYSSDITDLLESKGVNISYTKSIHEIPKSSKISDIKIIYSAAIKPEHPVLNYFILNGHVPIKRAVFLASIVNSSELYAVAGTHGKTTTSSILTHIFKTLNMSFSAFVGGMMLPDKTNFIFNGFEKTIVEADEFDRSFLNLKPELACITSIDADHLDIYKNQNRIEQAFLDFSTKVKGQLIIHHSISFDGLTYGLDVKADYVFENYKRFEDGYIVDIITPEKSFSNIFCKVIGQHNLENMLAAFALAHQSGKSLEDIIPTLATFEGIMRRMEVYQMDNKIIIDDYAHHPTEIAAVNKALRDSYPDSIIEVIFQPHLYSRTRDFLNDFAEELSKFDNVKLMEIYPAREVPIPGIESNIILEKITSSVTLLDKKDFNQNLDTNTADVIVILGAGSIGDFIKEYLKTKSVI
ncbi:UDP-N-acetylmuramate--L-alanine ligase [Flavobacteriaceae bacterium]|nr:UDP-N-acetylmuramate--L-alanine ligase [Flavobacteriaceae bacterium]